MFVLFDRLQIPTGILTSPAVKTIQPIDVKPLLIMVLVALKQMNVKEEKFMKVLLGTHIIIPIETRKIMKKTLAFPYFDNCSTVWGSIGKVLSDKLQKLQNGAARSITFCGYRGQRYPYSHGAILISFSLSLVAYVKYQKNCTKFEKSAKIGTDVVYYMLLTFI